MPIVIALATAILFGLGIFQILRRDLIKAAMGFAILFTAVNMFILAMGAYQAELPAYANLAEEGQVSDPLVQALILTAVVVGFGAYALMLSMINIVSKRYKTLDSDSMDELKR